MYPNQPQQGQFGGPAMNQPQQKGCWGRNWKWIVPTGCLGLILLGVAIVACVFFFVISAVKSSEVYQYALERARSNPEVVAELGEPIKDGWLVQGSVETSVGGRGHAKFQIPISGPKKSGTIYAEALKDPQVVGGTWYFTDLSVAVAGRADRIDLREKTSTGREPEEENDNANDATGEARQEEEYVEKVEPLTPQPPTRTPPSSTIVSGGVLNGKAVSKPEPVYPPIAKVAKASGTVTVEVTVDEEGNVISASAVSGHPLLQQAAVAAARQAKFSPTKLNGSPVKVSGILTYNFVLE